MLDNIYNELLPNALMIGVDYELFWELCPKTISPFIKAFMLKQKYDDTVAWQTGFYVKLAIVSALNKNAKYPTEPIGKKAEIEETPETKQEEIKRKFLQQMKLLNTRFGKEE